MSSDNFITEVLMRTYNYWYLNKSICLQPIPGLAAKVNEWHDSIRPKLQTASERGSFDIHAYGTKIIKNLQTNSFKGPKESVPFKDIVQGEKSEDIPRFFLATLMLVSNIFYHNPNFLSYKRFYTVISVPGKFS